MNANNQTSSKPVRLNLGCGGVYLEGYINVDHPMSAERHDLDMDLNLPRWDFPDNHADEILIHDALEHLEKPDLKMFEMHRVLKPGGVLWGGVPYAKSDGAFQAMEHKWFFTEKSFDAFCEGPGFYACYRKPLFRKEYVRLTEVTNTSKTRFRNLLPRPLRMLLRHFVWNMFEEVEFKLVKLDA
jgi:ubiquinone/menaquinone biosynthesis C-methylase UbiE